MWCLCQLWPQGGVGKLRKERRSSFALERAYSWQAGGCCSLLCVLGPHGYLFFLWFVGFEAIAFLNMMVSSVVSMYAGSFPRVSRRCGDVHQHSFGVRFADNPGWVEVESSLAAWDLYRT